MRRIHIHRWTMGLGIFAGVLGSISAASCTQPKVLCNVASGAYAVQYFPKEAGSDCLMLPGELVGMTIYHPPTEDEKTFDTSKTQVAVQALSVGQLADQAAEFDIGGGKPGQPQYSIGDYSSKPDDNDFCVAGGLSPAEQYVPETAYTDEEGNPQIFPETRMAYQWNNLEVYYTYAAPGSAATGEVTITREVTDPMTGTKDLCTVHYIANALYPAVGCEGTDGDGNPNGAPDDTKCCPVADLANGRTFGSGISPDFRVKCDPVRLMCTLDWRPGEVFPPMGANPACTL